MRLNSFELSTSTVPRSIGSVGVLNCMLDYDLIPCLNPTNAVSYGERLDMLGRVALAPSIRSVTAIR
jgi:hypothetical protein